MQYTAFQFLYPPRPNKAIPPFMLDFYAERGFHAQIKKNGDCSIMHVDPDRNIIARNRHRRSHANWKPNEDTRRTFLNLPGSRWYVFVAELMNKSIDGVQFRNINYINDILVADGEYLVGTTFTERQKLLASLFPNVAEDVNGGYYVIDPFTWLAKNHTGNFLRLFQTFVRPDDEGLVLKDPKARLSYCTRETSNVDWLVKCRRSTKDRPF